jgi:hypothetical protein
VGINSAYKLIFFLPGYSLKLNHDELLNQDVKNNTIRKNRPSHQDELIKKVRGYLRKRQLQPHIVENYFLENMCAMPPPVMRTVK